MATLTQILNRKKQQIAKEQKQGKLKGNISAFKQVSMYIKIGAVITVLSAALAPTLTDKSDINPLKEEVNVKKSFTQNQEAFYAEKREYKINQLKRERGFMNKAEIEDYFNSLSDKKRASYGLEPIHNKSITEEQKIEAHAKAFQERAAKRKMKIN